VIAESVEAASNGFDWTPVLIAIGGLVAAVIGAFGSNIVAARTNKVVMKESQLQHRRVRYSEAQRALLQSWKGTNYACSAVEADELPDQLLDVVGAIDEETIPFRTDLALFGSRDVRRLSEDFMEAHMRFWSSVRAWVESREKRDGVQAALDRPHPLVAGPRIAASTQEKFEATAAEVTDEKAGFDAVRADLEQAMRTDLGVTD
jgi:hypothetical protein